MKITPRLKPRPLKFGSLAHDMIEAEIEGKNPLKVLKQAETQLNKMPIFDRGWIEEEYGDIITDARYIMSAYFDYWDDRPESLKYLKVGKKLTEHPFEIQIDPAMKAKGRIDAFASAKKFKWLVEHKTHKNFPSPDHRWRNLQSVFYIRIAEMLDWFKLDGTCWDYIRSKPPTVPKMLKDGGISRAAIDTLPEVVVQFGKDNKLPASAIADMVRQQAENLPNWFQRIFTPVSKDIIQPVYDDFLSTSREMMDNHLTHKEKTFGRHCEWCNYRSLCAAELLGHDKDYIIEREFVANDYEEDHQVAD